MCRAGGGGDMALILRCGLHCRNLSKFYYNINFSISQKNPKPQLCFGFAMLCALFGIFYFLWRDMGMEAWFWSHSWCTILVCAIEIAPPIFLCHCELTRSNLTSWTHWDSLPIDCHARYTRSQWHMESCHVERSETSLYYCSPIPISQPQRATSMFEL